VGDVRALADAMFRLGSDAGFRLRLGRQASAWVRREVQPETVVESFRRLIDTLG
jgi:hypothetical protein